MVVFGLLFVLMVVSLVFEIFWLVNSVLLFGSFVAVLFINLLVSLLIVSLLNWICFLVYGGFV